LTRGTLLSRDIDLFHGAEEALDVSWRSDRALLKSHGYVVQVLRERTGVIEAQVSDA
jgi:hypothetical protein